MNGFIPSLIWGVLVLNLVLAHDEHLRRDGNPKHGVSRHVLYCSKITKL